jgi:hypothetical protein
VRVRSDGERPVVEITAIGSGTTCEEADLLRDPVPVRQAVVLASASKFS